MLRSKALGTAIIKSSEAPAVSGKAVHEAEAKAEFLVRELSYSAQVQEALRGIRTVNQTLDQVEQARDGRRILDALHLLESELIFRALWLAIANPFIRIVEATRCAASKQVFPGCQAARHQGVRAQVRCA